MNLKSLALTLALLNTLPLRASKQEATSTTREKLKAVGAEGWELTKIMGLSTVAYGLCTGNLAVAPPVTFSIVARMGQRDKHTAKQLAKPFAKVVGVSLLCRVLSMIDTKLQQGSVHDKTTLVSVTSLLNRYVVVPAGFAYIAYSVLNRRLQLDDESKKDVERELAALKEKQKATVALLQS